MKSLDQEFGNLIPFPWREASSSDDEVQEGLIFKPVTFYEEDPSELPSFVVKMRRLSALSDHLDSVTRVSLAMAYYMRDIERSRTLPILDDE